MALLIRTAADGRPVPPEKVIGHVIVESSGRGVMLLRQMIALFHALFAAARSALKSRRVLAPENLALRQQLTVLNRTSKRPKLDRFDRAFRVALSCGRPDWRQTLLLVKTRDGGRLAPRGLQAVLDVEERSKRGRCSAPALDPTGLYPSSIQASP